MPLDCHGIAIAPRPGNDIEKVARSAPAIAWTLAHPPFPGIADHATLASPAEHPIPWSDPYDFPAGRAGGPGLLSRVDDLGARARLPRNSVYRSVAGRQEYLAHYDRISARLPFPVQSRTVPTRFGATHLSIAGNPAGKPIIVLPGMSIPGLMMIEFFALLAHDHLLIAPDLIGQPGRSEDRPMPIADHAYGLWLDALLDALGLDSADVASGSFGSSIALDLAAIAPERVGRMALVVPAGLTPRLPYFRIFTELYWLWFVYRQLPLRRHLHAISRPLCQSLSDDNLDYLDIVIRQTAFWRHRPAGPFFAADLRGYRHPVFLVLAGRDIMFPHAPTRANAHKALQIAEEVVLPRSTHMPAPHDMASIHQRIARFMAGETCDPASRQDRATTSAE